MLSNDVRRVQDERGWTDATLLGILLDCLDGLGSAAEDEVRVLIQERVED
jgi:hypothetical protein